MTDYLDIYLKFDSAAQAKSKALQFAKLNGKDVFRQAADGSLSYGDVPIGINYADQINDGFFYVMLSATQEVLDLIPTKYVVPRPDGMPVWFR